MSVEFKDLHLEFDTAREGGFDPRDYEEEIEPLMSELDNYDGSRIYGALEMVAHGICPECAGNSCMDGDYENGEDTCNGTYSYDCDQGEMRDAPWLELYKYKAFQIALKDRMAFEGDPTEFWNNYQLKEVS